MINDRLLRQKTLEKIQKVVDAMEEHYRSEIKKMFLEYLPEARMDLKRKIDIIYTRYQEAEKLGKTGSLEWICISFLWSSLLDHAPCYRIDFYDSRGYLSEEEWTEMWDHHYLSDAYDEIRKRIIEMVECQNRLKLYETDDMLRHAAESLRAVSDEQLVQILRLLHEDFMNMTVKEHSLKIMLGDYLDEMVLVDEIWQEEMRKDHVKR